MQSDPEGHRGRNRCNNFTCQSRRRKCRHHQTRQLGLRTNKPLDLASSNMAVELRKCKEVLMEEEGDSFVRLFDILQRRNDKDKKLINRWITELPASSTDRKAKLGLKQPWLQSHKQAYLLDPEARKNV